MREHFAFGAGGSELTYDSLFFALFDITQVRMLRCVCGVNAIETSQSAEKILLLADINVYTYQKS